MGVRDNATQAAPIRGLVGRAGSTSMFDLDRWAPSDATARFVEHFWSVSWDLREQGPLDSTVITFPSLHLTHEWGDDGPRHGFPLPNTLLHGVVKRVFRTTISERGAVVGARFRPGGFIARFGRAAAALTGRVQPVDDELFCGTIHLDRHRRRVRAAGRADRRHYVGVPVKWVLCRYRLQQAALEIESRPGVDHADLAVRLGWYDQAHFINDFRAMLGTTQGEYAAAHGS
jgi:AraC-like DNA-binding protein